MSADKMATTASAKWSRASAGSRDKEVHEKADNTQLWKDFLKGRIRKELFKLGAVALYYTYTAMEEEIEGTRSHPHFAPLYFPTELHRREALARDLEYFYGPDWQSEVSCSPAAQRYVDRIHEVGQEDPRAAGIPRLHSLYG
ncbi:hypothetical protein KUCAC02_008251 [Chaenocephalus aceratus]|uniref:Uncharacterized protein n=1 Tax=Chaenocephalus aceratus TaxID=36190 RepID=A0ACB9X8Q0_CHAAC|nr:hypothetical protein KUCAC02_008251 [Chaenocephalus aceratus]